MRWGERLNPWRKWNSKASVRSMAVMLVTWLAVLVFVVVNLGLTIGMCAKLPLWAWIVLGVCMLLIAGGLRSQGRQRSR